MASNKIGSVMIRSCVMPKTTMAGFLSSMYMQTRPHLKETKKTDVIVHGITGKQGTIHCNEMVNYRTKIVGGVSPGKGGTAHFNLPVFNPVKERGECKSGIMTGHIHSHGHNGLLGVGQAEKHLVDQLQHHNIILPTRSPSMISPTPFQLPVLPRVIIEDPAKSYRPLVPVSCPVTERQTEIRATNRVKRQRKIHVRKKHRKQRLREMRYIIMKNQNEKEAVREAKWRKELSMSLKTALDFDADKYVRETIARAKWTPTPDNTESLRKGVFWSEFMTVEQLFGVPDGDYIDKKHGFPNDEDWEKILELREKYNKEYRRKKD